jgi:hypothetical protein
MPTPAQVMASIANSQASTGPRSEAGLATSSKNATKTGLYAANDFIRPGEEADYEALTARLHRELSPVTLLEENLTGEILRAMWKLRRCAQVEGTFAAQLDTGLEPIPDPMQNEAAAKLQNSVDRARAQSHRLLHRCTNELRRLQTDRLYLDEVLPEGTSFAHLGLADFRAILKVHVMDVAKAPGLPATKRTVDVAPQTAQIARNATCPCKSGEKYKRCCGKSAPAMLHAA